MNSVRSAALHLGLLAAYFGISAAAANAQAYSTASKGAEFSAFGGYMAGTTDYGPHSFNGYGAGVDFTIYPRFLLKPSLEVRADLLNNGDVTEKTVIVGPRLQFDLLNRLHPYGEFLIGAGEIQFHPAPNPDYTGDRSRALAYGGGLDYDLTPHWSVKLDYQQRSWNLGQVGNGVEFKLKPQVFLVGVKYTIPFRKLNRQGDFR